MLSSFLRLRRFALLVVLSLFVASACTPAGPVAPQAAATSVYTNHAKSYTFEQPAHWVVQPQWTGTGADSAELMTFSTTEYPKFKFTVSKKPNPVPPGAEASLAELCTPLDEARATYQRGTFEKKDFRLDGALCCYGILKEFDMEAHVLTALVDNQLYVITYQFSHKALFGDPGPTVNAEMERVFQSWRWQKSTAPPRPTPTPYPSPSSALGFDLDTNDYFPVERGATWTYQVLKKSVNAGTMTATVTDVVPLAEHPTGDAVTVARKWTLSMPIAGKATTETLVYEKFAGLHRVEPEGKLWVVRSLLWEGADWDSVQSHFQNEGYETVATPLGPLPGALKILETRQDGSTVASWYTTEFGLVQEVETAKDGEDVTITLADYTAP